MLYNKFLTYEEYISYLLQYDLSIQLQKKNTIKNNYFIKLTLSSNLNIHQMEKRKKITSLMSFLSLISQQQAVITKSKKNNILFKIKKGMIVGTKIHLRKKKLFFLLINLYCFVFPRLKHFSGLNKIKSNHSWQFKLHSSLNFLSFENEFLKFAENPPMNIDFLTCLKKRDELLLFLSSLLPMKKNGK